MGGFAASWALAKFPHLMPTGSLEKRPCQGAIFYLKKLWWLIPGAQKKRALSSELKPLNCNG